MWLLGIQLYFCDNKGAITIIINVCVCVWVTVGAILQFTDNTVTCSAGFKEVVMPIDNQLDAAR